MTSCKPITNSLTNFLWGILEQNKIEINSNWIFHTFKTEVKNKDLRIYFDTKFMKKIINSYLLNCFLILYRHLNSNFKCKTKQKLGLKTLIAQSLTIVFLVINCSIVISTLKIDALVLSILILISRFIDDYNNNRFFLFVYRFDSHHFLNYVNRM